MTPNDTQTITAFLLERIAEDEADARTAAPLTGDYAFARDDSRRLLVDPARVLAECAALREVVRILVEYMEGDYAPWNAGALRALASIWASHPAWREEWAS